MTTAVVLAGHGTVEWLEDLEPFTTNIRRGHPPPPELIRELERRYRAIGGKSPLTATCRELAAKLEKRIRVPVRLATRMWHPYPRDVVAQLAAEGTRRIIVVALAQFSSKIYGDSVKEAVAEIDPGITVDVVPNWGETPGLIEAFRSRIDQTIRDLALDASRKPIVLFSAHSLPNAALKGGDPYATEFRASVAKIAGDIPHAVAFQSQGATTMPGGWLGPDLPEALDLLKAEGATDVIFAPTGFLADHVEILYDLDIEARGFAETRGLTYARVPSLNADDDFVQVLAGLVTPILVLPRESP